MTEDQWEAFRTQAALYAESHQDRFVRPLEYADDDLAHWIGKELQAAYWTAMEEAFDSWAPTGIVVQDTPDTDPWDVMDVLLENGFRVHRGTIQFDGRHPNWNPSVQAVGWTL